LVEDEKKLARLLERQLMRAGYVVELAFDGNEAGEKAQTREFELIILDLNLPKKSGFQFLQELRAQCYATPVLILSARTQLEDRVKGLQIGGDDYLIKPFDFSELLARSEAILRRSGFSSTPILQAGDLILDVVHRTVKRASKPIELSQREYALLEYFLRNKNQVLTRKRLAEQVWGYKFDTGTNIVDVYVSYLRKAIDQEFSPKLIHTLYGEGFMLKDD
jgi:DNA-binding response OmpR family regulator